MWRCTVHTDGGTRTATERMCAVARYYNISSKADRGSVHDQKSLYRKPGPSLADAGPGARYPGGVGPPSVRLQWRYGGGGGFDSVRRGARGPVRPHQLHRPKDGPVANP